MSHGISSKPGIGNTGHRVGPDEMIDGLVAVLLTNLFRTYEDDAGAVREVQKHSELIGTLHSHIQKNYQERSLAAMAEEFGYRSTYLSALIRKMTGMTFKQMVNEERMKHAVLLLQAGNLPVYEVAESVGIANLTQFYQRFKDYVGCTPQQYRDKAMQAKLLSKSTDVPGCRAKRTPSEPEALRPHEFEPVHALDAQA